MLRQLRSPLIRVVVPHTKAQPLALVSSRVSSSIASLASNRRSLWTTTPVSSRGDITMAASSAHSPSLAPSKGPQHWNTRGTRLFSSHHRAKKFMVCIDGSDHAWHALETATSLMKPYDRLLVVTIPPLIDINPALGAAIWDALNKERDDAVAKILLQAEKAGDGLNYSTIVGEPAGGPREELLRIAQSEKADILVVGQRGLGAIKRAIMGSVSTYLIHHAECDVLVVRAPTGSLK